MAGMSRNLGGDVSGSEKLYVRKLWNDFAFHENSQMPYNTVPLEIA